jgi:hypothetical protein
VSVVLRGAIDTLETVPLNFSFLAPTIDVVLPSTMDADNDDVVIRGDNYGREEDVINWTPEEAVVNVSIGTSMFESVEV